MEQDNKLLLQYIRDIVYDPAHAVLDVTQLAEHLRAVGQAIQSLGGDIAEVGALAQSLAKGELDIELPSRENHLAAPLKSLHAALKHLTWQAQQVARGDYQQQVDFMGEFSEAFNSMTHQLEEQRSTLLQEIENSRQKAEALEQSNNLLEAITGQILQWILVMDGESAEWLYSNRTAQEVLLDAITEPQLRLWMKEQVQWVLIKEKLFSTELRLKGSAGIQYFTAEIQPLNWHGSSALAFVLTDVTSEREQIRSLEKAAYRDELTKLYNRHYGMEMLESWISDGSPFVLCFLDIDDLKLVNDRYGHSAGDRYLLSVSKGLTEFCAGAVLCRFGGDEFLLLVKHFDVESTKDRMEALRAYLITGCGVCKFKYSISYGIIEVGADNQLSADELIEIADEKMYQYKRAYKARSK